jgi:hypothetical protein
VPVLQVFPIYPLNKILLDNTTPSQKSKFNLQLPVVDLLTVSLKWESHFITRNHQGFCNKVVKQLGMSLPDLDIPVLENLSNSTVWYVRNLICMLASGFKYIFYFQWMWYYNFYSWLANAHSVIDITHSYHRFMCRCYELHSSFN